MSDPVGNVVLDAPTDDGYDVIKLQGGALASEHSCDHSVRNCGDEKRSDASGAPPVYISSASPLTRAITGPV